MVTMNGNVHRTGSSIYRVYAHSFIPRTYKFRVNIFAGISNCIKEAYWEIRNSTKYLFHIRFLCPNQKLFENWCALSTMYQKLFVCNFQEYISLCFNYNEMMRVADLLVKPDLWVLRGVDNLQEPPTILSAIMTMWICISTRKSFHSLANIG